MKHHVTYKPFYSLLIIFCLTQISGCGKKDPLENISTNKIDLSNPHLEITILDIGKADSILIKIDDKTIMIDSGLDKNGDEILDTLDRKEISKIDYMILTHLDKDHIGGADMILNNIEVEHVIQPNYTRDTKQYIEYVEALEENNITPMVLTEDLQLNFNEVSMTLYSPKKSEYEQSNDYSIMTDLTFKNQNFLFAGDAESERLLEFLTTNPSTYTFLKLPHHGQFNATLAALIEQTHPVYAAITCSEEQAPDMQTIKTLNNSDTQIFLTSDGNITIRSDGDRINLSQQLALPTSSLNVSYNGAQN